MFDPFHRGRVLAAVALPLVLTLVVPGALVAQDQGPNPVPAPPKLLQAFDVLAGTVQDLAVVADPGRDFVVDVSLGGTEHHVVLHREDVRAPGFQLLVRDGSGLHAVPTPACVTYRGMLLDDPASVVAATIEGGSMTALVRTGGDDSWVVQPVRAVDPKAAQGEHIVYRTRDDAPLPWTCGVTGTLAAPVPAVIDGDTVYECQLAIEADFPFYQQDGSNVTSTQNDVTGVINAVTSIYTTDVQIRYLVTQIIVDTVTDPYTSSVASTLLNQFGSYWNQFRTAVPRDTAHLFTGRPMGQSSGGAIGIATLSSVCNLGSAYGVSQSHFSTNFSRRVAVTAHELGHNWSAQHCDAVLPCYIMCSVVGGCSGVLTSFSPNERNQIISFRQTRGCLTVVPTVPVIATAVPSSVEVFRPADVTLSGTGFTGTTQVQVGSATLAAGSFTVLGDTQLRFTPPSGLLLGSTTVQATNSAGTSNAFTINYVVTNPCALDVSPVFLGGTTATFDFGGIPNDPYYLVVSLGNTTSLLQTWPVLDNLSVLAVGTFDALGIGSFSIPVPPMVLSGLTFYSQVLDLSAILPVLSSSSNIGTTMVLF